MVPRKAQLVGKACVARPWLLDLFQSSIKLHGVYALAVGGGNIGGRAPLIPGSGGEAGEPGRFYGKARGEERMPKGRHLTILPGTNARGGLLQIHPKSGIELPQILDRPFVISVKNACAMQGKSHGETIVEAIGRIILQHNVMCCKAQAVEPVTILVEMDDATRADVVEGGAGNTASP